MRILQLAVSLDYGGTETYVARLARGLVELGHEVSVLTEGGPLETLLVSCGVEVMRRSLGRASLPEVSAEIASRGFEIVNAHKYNGARMGQAISRATGIPYVMTVHGPRSFANRIFIRYWSRRVIALSGADKRGICGAFGVSPDRVSVSFPAIDPERHCSQAPSDASREELLPEPDTKLIAHVSRFTNRKARVTFELIGALPQILAKDPKARLAIVGTGEMFDAVAQRAERFNAEHGPVVRVVGPRLDVAEVFNLACVAVATAATAMEAMACGVPLVAAGRTGYLGLMDREGLDEGLDLLFGDHGRCPINTHAAILAQDILQVLGSREELREKAAELAKIVTRRFSPVAAAQSVLAIYRDAISEGPIGQPRRGAGV